MTGAIVPHDADCIVPVEDISITGNLLQIPPSAWVSGRFIDRKGSNHPAGSIVLRAGVILRPAELAIAATEGRASLTVNASLAIHIITTGDEIVPLTTAPQPWQIRGSHATALTALLSARDVTVTSEHVVDDPAALNLAISSALDKQQWPVLCGGVSKGGKDHVIDVLKSLGATLLFHRVAQRPGHPMAFAIHRDIPIFCLPGNPLSVLCAARRHLVPAIHRQRGASHGLSPIPISLLENIQPSPDSTRFLPIRLRDGVATTIPFRNSGSLHTLAETSGFVEIPPSQEALPAGTPFPYHPWQP
jgi:molybdopterin molybdotransferase